MATSYIPQAGDVVLFRNPTDAKLNKGGKAYRLEADGKALFAFRDTGGTIAFRYLRAEVSILASAGRIVKAER